VPALESWWKLLGINMVRFKNRWVLIEVQGEPVLSKNGEGYELCHVPLTAGMLHTALREAILANYGEYGLGCVLSSLNGKPLNN
jgi:hypothetical protein